MNVYLVRRDSQQILFTTLVKEQAIMLTRRARAEHEANLRKRHKDVEYELTPRKHGSRGKIYFEQIRWRFSKKEDSKQDYWSYVDFWVQKHQLVNSPLSMLASTYE